METSRPRRPTPRPEFEQATLIRRGDAPEHLWGDADGSHYVSDRIYISNSVIHVLEYTLPARGGFEHSAMNPTLFAADVCYVLLEGELVLADVEHGEVKHLTVGDIGFFGRDTWHHAFNPADGPVRVLEYFAPPPSLGTASTYGKTKALLEDVQYRDNRWDSRWPASAADRMATERIHKVSPADHLTWLPGPTGAHIMGTAVDTEFLRVDRGTIRAGHQGNEEYTERDSVLFVTDGKLRIHFPDLPAGDRAWHQLNVGDAAYLPANTCYQLIEMDGTIAQYWLGSGKPVAPGWTP